MKYKYQCKHKPSEGRNTEICNFTDPNGFTFSFQLVCVIVLSSKMKTVRLMCKWQVFKLAVKNQAGEMQTFYDFLINVSFRRCPDILQEVWNHFRVLKKLFAGWSFPDGAMDGCQPAEPGGEPALQVSLCGPTATWSLWLRRTNPTLLWNLQTCLLPGEFPFLQITCTGQNGVNV